MLRTFKQRLAEDELVPVFAMGRVVHPVVVEMHGLAGGYAGFWLDGEHVGLTTDQMVMANNAPQHQDSATPTQSPRPRSSDGAVHLACFPRLRTGRARPRPGHTC